MLLELTVFLPYLSDMFPQREELIIIPMNTACIKKKERKKKKPRKKIKSQSDCSQKLSDIACTSSYTLFLNCR